MIGYPFRQSGNPQNEHSVRSSLFGLVVHKNHVSSNPKNMKGQHSGMKRTNACSYALTWVDVGFNMKISVAVFLTGAIIALDETRTHPRVTRFVSLVDDVCSNPLHDERETHERTDMGRARHEP